MYENSAAPNGNNFSGKHTGNCGDYKSSHQSSPLMSPALAKVEALKQKETVL